MTDLSQTDLDDLLDEWLAGGETELADEPPKDVEQADRLAWALRKVDQRVAEVDDVVQRRVDALTVWRDQQLDQLHARRADLERLIEGWARAQHALDKSRKTWKLPSGMIPKLRERQARAVLIGKGDVAGVQAITGPGMLPPDAIKVERSVRPGVVKDATEPGEVIKDHPDVPEGYEAREAVGWFDFGGPEAVRRVVPGIVLLVPKTGPAGEQFSIQRPKAG